MLPSRALEILFTKTLLLNKYMISPEEDNPDWTGPLLEARGYGLPVGCYSDTANKFVITPKDLGHEDFDYCYGRGEWADYCWYGPLTSPDEILDANAELTHLAKFLMPYVRTSLCEIDGCSKGKVSATFYDPFDYAASDDKDLVVFVYGNHDDVLAQVQKACGLSGG